MRKKFIILTLMSLSSIAYAQEEVKTEVAQAPQVEQAAPAEAPQTEQAAPAVEAEAQQAAPAAAPQAEQEGQTMTAAEAQQAMQPQIVKVEPEKKTWSFYANFGVGYSTPVTLEGLQMSDADAEYFKKRLITPSFKTQGQARVVPTFKVGASYYFFPFRVSLDLGSQYVNQTNYHASNFNVDALFGFSPLKGNHEFNVDLGLGYYGLWNDYYYSWQGVDSNGNVLYDNGVPEQKTVYLGKHDVNTLSIPFKLSYLYNIADRHWLGAYFHGRVNCASEAFCPRFAMAVGVEYRFTLGKRRKARPAQTQAVYTKPVPAQVQSQAVPVYMPCQMVPCCPKQTKGGYYNYHPVYSPIYIVVSPGTNVNIETPEGTRISTSSTAPATTAVAPVAAPVAQQPMEYGEGFLADGRVMLLFEIGSAVITRTAQGILDDLDLEGVQTIDIAASTCAHGSRTANEQLGRKRLDAVKNYLRARNYKGTFVESNSQNDAPDPDWRSVFLRLVR